MKLRILAFETTGAHASVACIDENGNGVEEKSAGVLNHLQSLIPMTETLMRGNGIKLDDISCVAASAGPGSFTGIRIGVSTARAIAHATGLPCLAVPTLQSFLYNADGYRGLVCPALDARREQIYGGAYCLTGSSGGIYEAVEGGAYGIGEYLELVKRHMEASGALDIMFFGDGIKAYEGEIMEWQRGFKNGALNRSQMQIRFAEADIRFQTASSVAARALVLYREGRQVNYEKLLPIYMRKAEAERKLNRI